MKDFIDYKIIWKYFNSWLSKEEKEELDRWLEASSDHRNYFNKLKTFYNSEQKLPIIDSKKAWRSISPDNPFRMKHRLLIKAAAFVFVICVSSAIIYLQAPAKKEIVALEKIHFEPGVKKATLVLDNGNRLNLEAEKDTLIQQAEVVVKNIDAQLNYQAANKTQNKITYNTLMVPRGGEYKLELSDGTRVTINSGSVIKYPVNFPGQKREVQLTGEAFFEVTTDSLRPFIVHSGNIDVEVYGTSFNVNSFEEEENVTTTLVEGKVGVLSDVTSQKQELCPGEQSVYSKSSLNMEKKQVNIKEYTSWKDGRFYFRNMPVSDITKILERWYDVDFEFNNNDIRSIRFNGNLKRCDNIQTILNKLSKTNEITFTAYEKTIYLN
ncbi:MAG: FecR family protein [Draconibacterium sp.]